MEIAICIELIINLILLGIHYMHMFQLNSYFASRYFSWMNGDKIKVLSQVFLSTAITCLLFLKNDVSNVIAIVLLAIFIIYNVPKSKAKIPLKYTGRVKRMLATELVLVLLISIIALNFNLLAIALSILNVVACMLCVIANVINTPIESSIRNYYINDAKRILESMPNLKVIGVTGSYGKTSVKNFLEKTLSAKYEVLITPRNFNTTMGVVKTIRENLKPTHQIFVCEMGAKNIGDIKEICDLVKPDLGIITAIGPQHLDTFKSIDNIIKTKFELYDAVKEKGGVTFLNCDNEYIAKQNKKTNAITYGVNNDDLDYNAYNLSSSSRGLTFNIKDKKIDDEVLFKTKLIGKHNIENITGAIAVANYLDTPLKKMVKQVREINSVAHRLQIIPRGNLTIIDDAYNSNPVSSKSAIDTLGEFQGTKIVVTPGMIELGEEEYKYNFEFGKYMTNVCDYIVVVGEQNSKAIIEGTKENNYNQEKVIQVKSPQEAMAEIAKLNINGEIVVLLENDLPDNYK